MPGKGILGSLKNVMFEDESLATPASADTGVQSAVRPATPVSPNPGIVSFPTRSQFHQVNPEIKSQLDQAIAEANQLSYTEFTNYLEAMSSALAGSDEATRYRAALAASAKKGFAAQEIARGIDSILQVLQNEERNFSEVVSQRITERVGARESELTDIDRQINDNNAKISQLQAQNSQLASRKRTASEEIRNERQKVEDKKRDFAATVSAENNRYQEERNKILSYAGKGA